MLEHLGNAWISPQGCDGLTYLRVEVPSRVSADRVLEEIPAILVVARLFGRNVELVHGVNQDLCTVDDIFVYDGAVHSKLILGVSIPVENLKHFYDVPIRVSIAAKKHDPEFAPYPF